MKISIHMYAYFPDIESKYVNIRKSYSLVIVVFQIKKVYDAFFTEAFGTLI